MNQAAMIAIRNKQASNVRQHETVLGITWVKRRVVSWHHLGQAQGRRDFRQSFF